MRYRSLLIAIFTVGCIAFSAAGSAQARSFETWVSGNGTDAGDCPRSAPCRTFQYAHNRTRPGGTLNVASSGEFGPLNITTAISVVAGGAVALIRQPRGGAAIRVNAGANDVVVLRGLTIDLHGSSSHGIQFNSGGALHLDKLTVQNTNVGVRFQPTGSSALRILDSTVTNSATTGVTVNPQGTASATAVIDRARLDGGSFAALVVMGSETTGNVTATVSDSVMSKASGDGIAVFNSNTGTTLATIDRTVMANNTNGLFVSGDNVTARLGRSVVSGNTTGLNSNGTAVLDSYGDNQVKGNGTNGAPTSTIGTI